MAASADSSLDVVGETSLLPVEIFLPAGNGLPAKRDRQPDPIEPWRAEAAERMRAHPRMEKRAARFENCRRRTLVLEEGKVVDIYYAPSCRCRTCPRCGPRELARSLSGVIQAIVALLHSHEWLSATGDPLRVWLVTFTLPRRGKRWGADHIRARAAVLGLAESMWRRKVEWFRRHKVAGLVQSRSDTGLVRVLDVSGGAMVHRHAVAVGEELDPETMMALWTEAVHAAVEKLERSDYSAHPLRGILNEVRPAPGESIRLHVREVSTEGGIEGHLRRILLYLSKPRIRHTDAIGSAERIEALEVGLGGSHWVRTAGALYRVGSRRRKRRVKRRAMRQPFLRPRVRRVSSAGTPVSVPSPVEVRSDGAPPSVTAWSLAQAVLRAVKRATAAGRAVRRHLGELARQCIGAVSHAGAFRAGRGRSMNPKARGPPGG